MKRKLIKCLFSMVLIGTITQNVLANDSKIEVKKELYQTLSDQSDQFTIFLKEKPTKEFETKYKSYIKDKFYQYNMLTMKMPMSIFLEVSTYPFIKQIKADPIATVNTQKEDWGISKTNAPTTWKKGFTGKGIKIAIIDTGVDKTHPDLKIAGGISTIDGITDYQDDNGHGTHVAGIIAGQNNSSGYVGIAPDAQIYAIKALDAQGSGYNSDIIKGIDWAVANHMDIVSMSLGSQEDDPALKMAVDHAYNQGVLIVSAAGNDFDETVENGGCNNNVANDCVDYPAAYSSVIAVGAVDENENHAYFSSTGPEVEVSAPGVGIVSTYLNGQYAYMSGTSMATPYVAGELALLKQEFPEKTVVQIRKLLTTDVIDLGKTGHDNIYGYGFIQSPDLLSITSPTSLFINRLENETQRISSGKYLIKSISNEWYQIFDDNGQIRWAKPGYVKNITSLTITKPTSLFIDKNGNETERLSTGTYKIYQKYSDGWFKIYNNKGQIRWAKPGFVKEKAIYHIVIKGETLYSISKKFSVSVDSIKNLNKLKTNVIKVGQNLRIK